MSWILAVRWDAEVIALFFRFALGGFDGNVFLNTVETYEPRMNKWKLVSAHGRRRCCDSKGI